MAINLIDIRNAVIGYVNTKVAISIGTLTPATGKTINPNEEFTFSLTGRNANEGGIPLKNVIWHVWVEHDAVGTLIVPAAPMVARSGPSPTSPALGPGSHVKGMYLFPASGGDSLDIGESATISLRAKAGNNDLGGDTNIVFRIHADVDMDWLFPKDQSPPPKKKSLAVLG